MLFFHCPLPSGLQSPPANHICCLQAETHEHTVPHQDMVETSTTENEWEKKQEKGDAHLATWGERVICITEYLVEMHYRQGWRLTLCLGLTEIFPRSHLKWWGVIVSLQYVWLFLSKRQTEMNADCTGMHLLMLLLLVFLSLKCCVSASYSCWQM